MARCNELENQEKKFVTTLCKALPYMSDFDKGYFLGKAESCAERNLAQKKHEAEEKPVA